MCGRYVLALSPSQVRRMLENDDMLVDDAPADEGDGAPRQSYNFAPGYHGIVYRADVPDWGAGPRREAKQKKGGAPSEPTTTHYKLQSMRWGLIPFWTKRNPDYAAVMKTINCRDDSLAQAGGMWSSMKGRKRCIVVAQGFYEWLKSGRDKVPHFVKRKDGRLMCFAGLWDCVKYEGEYKEDKNYTYTIITTDSNKQLKFLHDRMPVILEPASEQMRTWLDPSRYEWDKDLQAVLKPFEGELEVYPVSKEVGKVGNNSPSFIIPVASRENKSNIANFFANAQAKQGSPQKPKKEGEEDVEVKQATTSSPVKEAKSVDEVVKNADDGGMGVSSAAAAGEKRKGNGEDDMGSGNEEPPRKKKAVASSPLKAKPSPSPKKSAVKGGRSTSATSNGTKSPMKAKGTGTPKITQFFGNSA
ncbi:DUF159-domain-containing protein [Cryphonectria parasitica EP155]|uniref:DUF159-domain-containing protein n=1 Tax=Cryphonectria parasitica (strain ATCC 38755 / EP155) TaxID=660469 RepID=A0A9P4XTP5_CRYP1|nr:DUF159-domain-containing protein [Cryphonectria parasitica EP155]KAF3761139.1 DUF159-domain-containing protein [Cryphonectria parasitica EP155]